MWSTVLVEPPMAIERHGVSTRACWSARVATVASCLLVARGRRQVDDQVASPHGHGVGDRRGGGSSRCRACEGTERFGRQFIEWAGNMPEHEPSRAGVMLKALTSASGTGHGGSGP